MGLCIRNKHQQLFIGTALKLWLRGQAVGPGLLDNGGARASGSFVESTDVAKVNLVVQERLKCRCDIVAVVVDTRAIAVVLMTIIFIVTVRRHFRSSFLVY